MIISRRDSKIDLIDNLFKDKLYILIVDDEPFNVMAFKLFFTKYS